MSEQLQVIITGSATGAIRAFNETGAAAKKAGNDVESAGKESVNAWAALEAEAQQVAREMKASGEAIEKTGDTVKRSGQSAREAAVDFDKLGITAIAIGGALTLAGDSALDQIQTIEGLRSAYGDAADDMLAFADQMASTSIFNDDDIMRGQRYFATLVNNYDLSIAQAQELMRVTADLASAYGTTFEDASSRITAAIRGEGEAAEYLGLTMNQQSIDRENLTLTMSNQEAAQFRLNALYQQTGVYAGNAERLLNTEVGSRAKLTNAIKDNMQAFAGFMGPYNTWLAGMATGAVGVAQFAAGLPNLARGIQAATRAMAGFVASPIGIAATGLAAVLAIATDAFMRNRAEAAETAAEWESAAASGSVLTQSIRELASINWADASWARSFRTNVMDEFEWMRKWTKENLLDDFGSGTWFDEMVMSQIKITDLTGDMLEVEWKRQADKLLETILPDGEDEDRFNQAMTKLLSLESVLTPEQWDATKKRMDSIWDTFNANESDPGAVDKLNGDLERLYSQQSQLSEVTGMAANANWDYIDSVHGANVAVQEQTGVLEEQAAAWQKVAEENQKTADAQAAWWDDWDTITDQEREADRQRAERRRRDRMELLAEAQEHLKALALQEFQSGRVAGAEILNNQGIKASINEVKAAYQEMAAARESELKGLISSAMGLDDPLTKWNAAGLGDGISQAAENLRDVSNSLDTVWRVTVQNTNAFASQAQAVEDWATELINVKGEYGEIDRLLKEGLITQTEYTQAQTAYNDIVRENAEIQDHVLAIQAQQAPVIRDQLAMLENTLQVISEMEGGQQLAALGWLDAASAAKALEINTLGVAAATGELGSNGRTAFQSFIDGITATDPVMTQMLVQMGAIEEHIDSSGNKTYTINWAGLEEGESSIDRIIDRLDVLIRLLGGMPPIDMEDLASGKISEVEQRLLALDGTTTHTVDVQFKTPGDAGSFLGGRIQDLMGLGADPLEVPVVGVWDGTVVGGDGTGGAMGPPSMEPITVPVTAQITEISGLPGTGDGSSLIDGLAQDVEITVTQVGMETVIGLAQATQNAVEGIPSDHVTSITEVGAAGVIGLAQAATNAIDAIPDSHATTISLIGAEGAIGSAHAVANAINAIPTSRTSQINVVTQYSSVGTPSGRAHGGIAQFATGGMVPIWTSEPGTEIAHLPTGGMVALPGEGLRFAPPGTFIEPPNSARDKLTRSERPIQIIIQGNVVTERDLITKSAQAIWAAERQEEIRALAAAGERAS